MKEIYHSSAVQQQNKQLILITLTITNVQTNKQTEIKPYNGSFCKYLFYN